MKLAIWRALLDVTLFVTLSYWRTDGDWNRDLLLEALRPRQYHLIRINAADALANTKDPQVLTALERYSREERDNYVRQRLQKATDKIRALLRP